MIEFIASVLFTIAEHSIKTFFLGFVIAGIIIYISVKIRSKKIKKILRIISVLVIIYGFLNIFIGNLIAGIIINKVGEFGSAVTVSIKQTNNQYNDYWIYEHLIILETNDGSIYETSFEDADFNIYPEPEQGYIYPSIGEKYTVKYLKRNPKAFIIVSNDNSPFAKRIRCQNLKVLYDEAKLKLMYDSLNTDYKEKYNKLRNDYFNNGCQ